MTDTQTIQACERELSPETFKALGAMLMQLSREKKTAILRHNHYAIGMEAMVDHMSKCPDGPSDVPAFTYIKGDPHGHFECVLCGEKA